ncbi:MAG TPA: type II CAAX endopeptidase family protein [Xanthobacteraceae bacterium]|nr:type II CAAX endopeptidase family protein [Xanthobacteraceae bacterium]
MSEPDRGPAFPPVETDGQACAVPAGPAAKRWGFWSTTAWGVVILAAWAAAQFAVMVVLLWWRDDPADFVEPERLLRSGSSIAFVAIGGAPMVLAMVALAVRLSGRRLAEYLALRGPTRRDWILGILSMAVLLPALDLATGLTGRDVTPFVVLEAYRTARDAGTLPWLALALVVAAPVTEEVTFRGFLFRGWAASRLGVAGAVALTSFFWAAMHVQYDWFFMLQIFVLGLVLGWLRQRSGSTLLTMALHAGVNLWALMQAATAVG